MVELLTIACRTSSLSSGNPFCHGIRQYGYGMITDHTPVFIWPYGLHTGNAFMYALFAVFQHGAGNIGIYLAVNDIE